MADFIDKVFPLPQVLGQLLLHGPGPQLLCSATKYLLHHWQQVHRNAPHSAAS